MGGIVMKTNWHWIIPAVLTSCWLWCACGKDSAPEVKQELDEVPVARTGAIRGTILGCDGELLRDARVDINSMPDSMVDAWFNSTPRYVYPATYFDNAFYHDTLRTDSLGRFRFDNLSPGYYQIWFHFDLRLVKRDSCDRFQLGGFLNHQADFVRVAPDSISVVGLSAEAEFGVQFARDWFPEYEPLDREKEESDK
jgi:hypothetical protein